MTRAIAFDIVESEYQVQCRMPPFEFVVCIISRSNNLKHKAPLQRRWPDNPHSIVRHRVQIKRWLRGAGDNYGIIWSAVRGPGALVAETIIIGQQRPLQPYTCLDVKDKWSMLDVGWAWCLHEDGGWGSARWRKEGQQTRRGSASRSKADKTARRSRAGWTTEKTGPGLTCAPFLLALFKTTTLTWSRLFVSCHRMISFANIDRATKAVLFNLRASGYSALNLMKYGFTEICALLHFAKESCSNRFNSFKMISVANVGRHHLLSKVKKYFFHLRPCF